MTTDTFIAGRGFLYRMDPRAKIVLLLLLVVWFFLPVSLLGLLLMALCLLFVSFLSTGGKATGKVMLSILPMVVFMVLFMPFSSRDGQAIVRIGSFVLLTKEGMLQTLLLILRFLGITVSCTLLFSTTRMPDVMLALSWYRLPYRAVLVISLAFTYIPFISDSFGEIMDSHKLREAEGEGKKHRLKDMVPTLTSALVVSLRSIPFLAMSLEERGYGRKEKRSSYHDLSSYHHLLRDFLLSLVFVTLTAFLFWM
jgi:energy-coupling factor transport system permease protein